MEFELKSLSPEAVARAMAKAERYRLLNEPAEAESICLDALAIEPDNHEALVNLLLALTEQFEEDLPDAVTEAFHVIDRMRTLTNTPTIRGLCGSGAARRSCIGVGWDSARKSMAHCVKP